MRRKPPTYGFHPCCELFPLLSAEGRARLAADIKANGLRNKITLFDKKTILDGRNRYLACGVARVKPEFVAWDGKGTPLEFVLGQNLQRRQLSSSQRAVLALNLLPHLEAQADRRKKLGQKIDQGSEHGRAAEIAAKKAGSNRSYVYDAEKIEKETPKLVKLIWSGDLELGEAKALNRTLVKLPSEQKKTILKLKTAAEIREEVAKVREAAAQAKVTAKIIPGVSNLAALERAADGTVDLFLATGDGQALAELAAVKLKPGGLLLCYGSQATLRNDIEAIQGDLKLWCCFAVRANEGWLPVLAFAKGSVGEVPGWADKVLREEDLLCRLADKKNRNLGTGDWAPKTANIIVGCTNNCVYCFAHANCNKRNLKAVLAGKEPEDWSTPKFVDFDQVDLWRHTKVMFPSSHDIELPLIERNIEAIKRLLAKNNEVLVVSKPRLDCIKRLCAEFKPSDRILFRFTIGSFDEELLKRYEPGAPSYAERMAALKHAFDAGFQTSVSCEPLIDTANILKHCEQLKRFVREKIWLGEMTATGDPEAGKHEVELKELRAGQKKEELLPIYQAFRDDPVIKWKSHTKKKLEKLLACAGQLRDTSPSAGAGLPLVSIAASAEPICV